MHDVRVGGWVGGCSGRVRGGGRGQAEWSGQRGDRSDVGSSHMRIHQQAEATLPCTLLQTQPIANPPIRPSAHPPARPPTCRTRRRRSRRLGSDRRSARSAGAPPFPASFPPCPGSCQSLAPAAAPPLARPAPGQGGMPGTAPRTSAGGQAGAVCMLGGAVMRLGAGQDMPEAGGSSAVQCRTMDAAAAAAHAGSLACLPAAQVGRGVEVHRVGLVRRRRVHGRTQALARRHCLQRGTAAARAE